MVSLRWLVSDRLGTPLMTADQTGRLAGIRRHDYFSFGEEIGARVGGRTTGQGYAADNVRQKFTGYERDSETSLHYAPARYYAPSAGRFNSPDPLLASATPFCPQSWNRYSYVYNNPLKYTDPPGLMAARSEPIDYSFRCMDYGVYAGVENAYYYAPALQWRKHARRSGWLISVAIKARRLRTLTPTGRRSRSELRY